MQLRRTALTVGALLLTVTPLSACGGVWASERNYPPAVGSNNRDGSVDVLGAVIVAPTANKGVLIATLVNNDGDNAATLTGIDGGASGVNVTVEPTEIPAHGSVNLADDGGLPVTGEFEAGNYREVTLNFDGADPVTINVPVVLDTDEFEGLGG